MEMLEKLCWEMIGYYAGQPAQIQHFTKVHAYARLIGLCEHISGQEQFILEALAYVHDIGIRPAMEKYGSGAGPLQEKEGPAYARPMLEKLGFDEKVIDRVCWLIAHHHTVENVDGIDWRILLEADLLVNLHEGKADRAVIAERGAQIFRTETGTKIFRLMFGE